MKRLLILLILPILACGGLAESVSPTITPPAPLTVAPVSYTHLRAHETVLDLVCRLLLEKKTHQDYDIMIYTTDPA